MQERLRRLTDLKKRSPGTVVSSKDRGPETADRGSKKQIPRCARDDGPIDDGSVGVKGQVRGRKKKSGVRMQERLRRVS